MIFAASAIAATSGYVIGGLMFSLGAQIAHDLVASDNALVNGVVIALFALAAGVGRGTRQAPDAPPRSSSAASRRSSARPCLRYRPRSTHLRSSWPRQQRAGLASA